MALRGRIRTAQLPLRTLFLIRMALWKYRAQTPGFELPAEVLLAQQQFDTQSANKLDAIADRIEGKSSSQINDMEDSFAHLQQVSSRSARNNGRTRLGVTYRRLWLCRGEAKS
jgi:multidrug resistance protein MdtO